MGKPTRDRYSRTWVTPRSKSEKLLRKEVYLSGLNDSYREPHAFKFMGARCKYTNLKNMGLYTQYRGYLGVCRVPNLGSESCHI